MYTRCTYCDSWLKVNAEQLRAGLGQVRCGSCEQVFSALVNLTDISPSTPELEPVAVPTLAPTDASTGESSVATLTYIADFTNPGHEFTTEEASAGTDAPDETINQETSIGDAATDWTADPADLNAEASIAQPEEGSLQVGMLHTHADGRPDSAAQHDTDSSQDDTSYQKTDEDAERMGAALSASSRGSAEPESSAAWSSDAVDKNNAWPGQSDQRPQADESSRQSDAVRPETAAEAPSSQGQPERDEARPSPYLQVVSDDVAPGDIPAEDDSSRLEAQPSRLDRVLPQPDEDASEGVRQEDHAAGHSQLHIPTEIQSPQLDLDALAAEAAEAIASSSSATGPTTSDAALEQDTTVDEAPAEAAQAHHVVLTSEVTQPADPQETEEANGAADDDDNQDDDSQMAFTGPIYADPPLFKLHEDTTADVAKSDDVAPAPAPAPEPGGDALLAATHAGNSDDPNDLARVFDQSKAFDPDEIPIALRADYARKAESQPGVWSRAAVIGLSLVALLLLPAQYAWFMPDDLVRRYPLARPVVEQFCASAGCEYQSRQNRGDIELVSRDVRIHPRYEGALQVQAAFSNRGPDAQTYPQLRFTLFNVNGDVIASRLFSPQEYLQVADASALRFKSGQTTQIQLDLLAPDDAAVSFEFEFI